MRLPRMRYGSALTKSEQVAFGGLNLTKGAGDGELIDMWNLTSDHYPVLSTRPRRYHSVYQSLTTDLYCWKELVTVSGYPGDKYLIYGDRIVGQVTDTPKTFGALGNWLVIWPDQMAYNLETGVFRSIGSSWSGTGVSFTDGVYADAEAKGNTITCEGIFWSDWFSPGDAVEISGCTTLPENNGSLIIREIEGGELRFYENSFTVGQEEGTVTIARKVPELDHICQHDNRLWGCKGDTIYASKLGDVFNWYCYDGLDSDSYAVDTGSPGAFSACCSYGGYPVFFKEDRIFKVYGSLPSAWRVVDQATIGVAQGCHRSLAVAGELLLYQARTGIMAYTGGVPVCVSDALDQEGTLWICGSHQEPEFTVVAEENFPWRAEFADFHGSAAEKKGVNRLTLRLETEADALCNVFIRYDSEEESHAVASIGGKGIKESVELPLVPRRCDHFRVILVGVGGCRIHSMTAQYYIGSMAKSRRE